ncbi:UDP-glycosyltransferase 76B1-like [Silene latifolia]|uniref:UDP-glycosyltransferase 76B1-like n=1 Tax=Silene latifolia TaxID=37657 RepID=UPI003D777446
MRKRLVLFPLPLQGHQTPMLQLANILYSKGFSISIIHTQYNAPNSEINPHFTFHPIPNSLSQCETYSKEDVIRLIIKLNALLVAPFRDLLAGIVSDENAANKEPVACLITDAMWYFTQDVADNLNLPRIVLRTSNAACFYAFFYCPVFKYKGYLSAKGSELEAEVPEFPPLKMKDIPIHGTPDPEQTYELVCAMIEKTKASSGLILNTFQQLELTSLSAIRKAIPPIPIFAIGPFHKQVPASSSSLFAPDQSCISWLNVQAPNSVLYVSFGSIAAIEMKEFTEIALGLANSKQPFLWVVRPGLVRCSDGNDPLPSGFMEMVAERGRVVKWAPQQEVLAHPAVGGFWTHTGWNSTLESICEGVPMLCLPCFGDQMINARYVTDVWKVGFRFEDQLRRDDVEKVIRRLMVDKEGQEMRQKMTSLKEKACLSKEPGGPSYSSLESLVAHISSFSMKGQLLLFLTH